MLAMEEGVVSVEVSPCVEPLVPVDGVLYGLLGAPLTLSLSENTTHIHATLLQLYYIVIGNRLSMY